ncbi:MAG: hypothetical protein FJ042_02750 [Candidatus Cloacimonetes bacterium]|nr:hypothetical protein [Candidatus Cloacimonadota bacterium]
MKRHSWFLHLILALLLVNIIFFTLWYTMDVQGYVKGIVEKEISEALGGLCDIQEFSFNDSRLIAHNITFSDSSGSIRAQIGHVRIKYNLLKLFTSWFNIGKSVSFIEIEHADVSYTYRHDVYSPPGQKQVIPDLSRYFRGLKLSDSRLYIHVHYPAFDSTSDSIRFHDVFSDVSISIDNQVLSTIQLSAVSSNRGAIKATALIENGRIKTADGEIENYRPLLIHYPYGEPIQSDISLFFHASRPLKDKPLDLDYKAILWNTRTTYLGNKITIPYISMQGNSNSLSLEVMGAMYNGSTLDAILEFDDIQTTPSVLGTVNLASISLTDLESSISGMVKGSIQIEGTLDDPTVKVELDGNNISTEYADFTQVQLSGEYVQGIAQVNVSQALWQAHTLSLSSEIDLKNHTAKGSLSCRAPQSDDSQRQVNTDLDFDLVLIDGYPGGRIDLLYGSYKDAFINLLDYNGRVEAVPSIKNGVLDHYLVDADLTGGQGIKLMITGDLINRLFVTKVSFDRTLLHLLVNQPIATHYKPELSGSLTALMNGQSVTGRLETTLRSSELPEFDTTFESLFQADIGDLTASIYLSSIDSRINGIPFSFGMGAEFKFPEVKIFNLTLNDKIRISGNLNLANFLSSDAQIDIVNLNQSDLVQYVPDLTAKLPGFSGFSINLAYNQLGRQDIDMEANLRELSIGGLLPLSAGVTVTGDIGNLSILGDIAAGYLPLTRISGTGSVYPQMSIELLNLTEEISLSQLLADPGISGLINGKVSFKIQDIAYSQPKMIISGDLSARQLLVEGFVIDEVRTSFTQYDEYLQVDTLRASNPGMFDLCASGSLDYNLLTNTFYEGNRSMDISAHSEIFTWLKSSFSFIEEASGSSLINCRLSTSEDQFNISSGDIDIRSPLIRIAGQGEPITDFVINAYFDNNRVIVDHARFRMGLGELNIHNVFDSDTGDHFSVGFLDLGRFLVSTDYNGIIVNVPEFSLRGSITRAVIRGRKDNWASVRGPFDDMKISAEILIANSNVVYPSGTDNLLNLARTVREATVHRPESDEVPLPFVLDLMLVVQNNVRYVTYPANLEIFPGSFIHVVYDGNAWDAVEADFSSERGSFDFFGTVFHVDEVTVSIIQAQDLMQINGQFFRRTPDGTTVSLSVSTDKDTERPLLSRLEFNLKSDNPQDITITHILSRLRYNRSIEEIDPSQRQSLLQDEALNLLYGNINTSLLNPFLYPLENRIRRWLRLDSFTISAGFIQNLLNQYTTTTDMFSDSPNLEQYDNDILRFSSAVLLNNLSISAGKNLWRRIYADYMITLQEETDIAKQKQILVTHNASLRFFLPLQLRLAYTLQYKPYNDVLSHEVMLQRTFRF